MQRRTLGVHLRHAMRLTCPFCGVSPLFKPFAEVRSLRDWFTPLPGCTPCGYPYERESGYFLLATWAITYGVAVVVGLAVYLAVERSLQPSLTTLFALMVPPVAIVAVAVARHSKALFLALDRFIDPG